MRCARPSPPDASSVSRFHEALRLGQVGVVRRMIHRDASLVNARASSSPRATSLMAAATSRQSSLSSELTLVKLLLAKGASLRTKDGHRCNVLMAVCASGAHVNIVKCLLDEDRRTNSNLLSSLDRDEQGRTALGLACFHGHGRLASFVLDLIEVGGADRPLDALNMALLSGDELCVLELLRNRKLRCVVREDRREQKLVVHGQWNQTRTAESGREEVTVRGCVAKAVELEMVAVVRDLHRLNRRSVGHATWLAVCRKGELCGQGETAVVRGPTPVRPEFDEIADLHRRDSVWERMKVVFLIRHAPPTTRFLVGGNIVAQLPDAVFRIVAEYLKPKFDDAEEAQKERFKAVLDLSSW